MEILFLTPQCYPGPGGIPVYMRRLREALNEYAVTHGATVHCLSLNDTEENLFVHARPVDATQFLGCGGSKTRFLACATRMAWRRRYDFALVGLLGMAPAAYWLKLARLVNSYAILLHGFEAWVTAPAIERIAARNAQVVIATTNYTAGLFAEKNGIYPERNRIVPLCVGESRAAVQARPCVSDQPGRGFTILAVGRMECSERQKGIDTLIQAMPQITAAAPEVRLLLAGGGADRSRLEALVHRLGVASWVTFLGVVDDGRLQQLYRECDVLALPSKQEGFGIVFLEAMSHSKPCIGGAHGGIPEVIVDGETGLLVPFGNCENLAQAIIRLASSPELARRMGEAGRQRLLRQYCYDSFSANFAALFDELGNTPPPASQDASCARALSVPEQVVARHGGGVQIER